ncbi:helix-turn-helix transcriptional regulator [Streptomyces violaceusniger]|uniref:helix-turn-helix transcriptional regulator n=1 Tax=Streptomyces violaceusniger TaxID=68280 RepID=UPI0009C28628|nr:hypothetical protein [Streptomyces hygroscopicus]AQW55270.1 hypothetical protein SHXM_08733 [Streptomyces hygroscopicus]
MPTESERGERLMTQAEIIAEQPISRQTLHNLRTDPKSGFPAPHFEPGSTRPKWRESEIAEFFATYEKRPGRRTDLESGGE